MCVGSVAVYEAYLLWVHINVTNQAALGEEGRTIYSATEAGLIGMTRTWPLELGCFGIPVKRLGAPADVAAAAGFFTSKEAGFVTGQALYVCGGLTVGLAH